MKLVKVTFQFVVTCGVLYGGCWVAHETSPLKGFLSAAGVSILLAAYSVMGTDDK
jgi:hypothetical protein